MMKKVREYLNDNPQDVQRTKRLVGLAVLACAIAVALGEGWRWVLAGGTFALAFVALGVSAATKLDHPRMNSVAYGLTVAWWFAVHFIAGR